MARAKQPQAVKPPLFDRIFPPRVMAVGDHTVPKPRSRAWLLWLVTIAAVWGSVELTGFDIGIIVRRGYQFTVILQKIFNPDWTYFNKVIPPLLDTIKMSVMGSVIGSLLSLPFAVAASANINKSGILVAVLRVVLNIVRTLPTLVIASICALIFNLGTFAGTVAITVFTFGIVAKMLYESIETIDMGAFEAMEALGASKFQAFWSAVFPQILPTYLSHCLYSFEINIRAASILGISERNLYRKIEEYALS
jgi:phosphonate transport system permease protein